MLVIDVAFVKLNIVMILSLSSAGVLSGFIFLYSLAFAFSPALHCSWATAKDMYSGTSVVGSSLC